MRDHDIRAALRAKLSRDFAGDDNTRIVEEMGVWSGSVRIDMAVINGELSGFELKSDRDTLERLPFQADLYSRVFDRVSLVVGERHFQTAVDYVPYWWGVLIATQDHQRIRLELKREAELNPSPEPYLVAQLLWKEEALSVLEVHDLAQGWRSKRVKDIHTRLATELPFEVLADHVRVGLKKRKGWLRQSVSG